MRPDSILWRRLDGPGHDVARLRFADPHWHLAGTAVFAYDGQPCRLDWEVACDQAWRTLSGRVSGWIGSREVDVALSVEAPRRWRLDGVECPHVAGCLDLDLQWSPATNLLPIRRLGLAVGAAAPVRSAWLRFPGLVLEPLEQVYRRIDAATYRYETADGRFARDLEVNAAGFVTRYPGQWEAESAI